MSAPFRLALLLGLLTVGLSGCVGNGVDLFGGDKVDRSISTSTVAGAKSTNTLSDEMTVRNAVTSADVDKLEGKPLPWANASTGSAGVITAIEQQTDEGAVCRQFQTTRHSYGGVANFQGTACLADNGSWQLLSFQESKQ